MMTLSLLGLTVLVSYLVGGVPFGWLVARARGVDILRQGSGNIGATNVGRVLGRRFGALVFLLDFAKGALPVLAASALTRYADDGLPPDSLRVAAGVAAFLGHLFPVYLRFRGGKGVATGVGVVSVLLPVEAVSVLLLWVAVLAASRYVSLASIAAGAFLCVLRLAFTPGPWERDQIVVTLFCLFGAVVVVARHAGNIGRLLRGSENRLQDSPFMLLLGKTLHVLAVGLWFGAAVFFTITGVLQVESFQAESSKNPRPLWFPVPDAFAEDGRVDAVPEAVRKEQGSRAFGAAVSPLFIWYYGIQGGCGLIAAITALGWAVSYKEKRVHLVRAVLVLVALAGVGVGWWLNGVVTGLREPRNKAGDALLQSRSPAPEDVQKAEAARAEFGAWHGYSLIDNFVVLALATAVMALAAQLPGEVRPAPVGERGA